MIPRDLLAAPPSETPEASFAAELQQALWGWKRHSEEGAAALGRHDLDALDAALAARDALRPRILELIRSVAGNGRVPRQLHSVLRRLQTAADEADARLVALLTAERSRLQREIEGGGRSSASLAAYGRPGAPSPHRLNIVR